MTLNFEPNCANNELRNQGLSPLPSPTLPLLSSLSRHSTCVEIISVCLRIYLSASVSCPPVHLSVCISFLSVYRTIRVHIYPCLSVYPCVYLSVCLSIYLFVYPSIFPSVYLSIRLSIRLSICLRLSIGLSVYQSILLPIRPSAYLSIRLSIFLSV